MNFKNKKILIVGFGHSGQAAARYFLGQGASVAATDLRSLPLPLPTDGVFKRLECHWGDQRPEIFQGRDLICLSPGVPGNLPGLKLARRHKIPIVGEFGLAASLLKSPMIAVTGTNGKSTTVTLIAEMLKKAGKKVALAGNIGRPLMDVVMTESGYPPQAGGRGNTRRRELKGMQNKREDWVVAEVSSYQLETADRFHPKIAVLLNVTEDHLDRYASFREYAEVKCRIFKNQTARDWIIYNEEDLTLVKAVKKAKAKKIAFPLHNLDIDLSRAKLVGFHNAQNMMAAIAAARLAGVSSSAIQKTLDTFKGLPHRTQFVREFRGVRYYDDSKGTNVDAVVQSLAGFPDGKVILIAGGRDKGGSYEPLRLMATKKTRLLITIGEAREKIVAAMKGSVETVQKATLEEAVRLAALKGVAGDIVLISPACSSFDQFRDYKERGEIFQRLVREL